LKSAVSSTAVLVVISLAVMPVIGGAQMDTLLGKSMEAILSDSGTLHRSAISNQAEIVPARRHRIGEGSGHGADFLRRNDL